jgi:hypothetical protein
MKSLLDIKTAHVPVLYERGNHGTTGHESLETCIQACTHSEADQHPTTILHAENICVLFSQRNTVTQGMRPLHNDQQPDLKGLIDKLPVDLQFSGRNCRIGT